MARVVIIGQGYVGLPLAVGAATAGHSVIGLDMSVDRVNMLNARQSPVDDISDDQIAGIISAGYTATTDASVIANADVVVICVPTPLGENKSPDLTAVNAAVRDIAANAKQGALVVLESTTYPGTTANVVKPQLERAGFVVGEDLYLAFSPERIDPGNPKYGLENTPKVVGADDEISLKSALGFYGSFVESVVPVRGTAEAELTKLLENTYRHVNIALVNEIAIFARELGIDIWEVIAAASTKPFGFQPFYPGPGVGGHCIPIDPNYLSYRVKETLDRPFRFVELAEEINSSMPGYVVERIQDALNDAKKPLNGSRVLLLGVTYKSGISDTRESPAVPLAKLLASKGVEISFFDPFVTRWRPTDQLDLNRVPNLHDAVKSADVVALLQHHESYEYQKLVGSASIFFDTRGATGSLGATKL